MRLSVRLSTVMGKLVWKDACKIQGLFADA